MNGDQDAICRLDGEDHEIIMLEKKEKRAMPDASTKKPVIFIRPADRSLEAFKGFIMGAYKAISGRDDDPDKTSEAEWTARWKSFWGKIEAKEAEIKAEQEKAAKNK